MHMSSTTTPPSSTTTTDTGGRTVVVVTGAEPLTAEALSLLPADATVIAADSGLDHALDAGLRPSELVGDLDSVSDAGRTWAGDHCTIHPHPTDKDATDTELALARAADHDPDRIILVSGGGDRLDHTLAVLGALGGIGLTSVPEVEAVWGRQRMRVVHGPGRVRLPLRVGSTVSLLSLHGPAEGVSINGTRWELEAETLDPLAGRGVSNEVVSSPIEVRLTTGILCVITDGWEVDPA
ncbi:MAG: putative thiamine pyrophosphokinae [Actinomycetota bacterium]|jgi:thiamine pyrophosphokinase